MAAQGSGAAVDPIHQFELNQILPINIFGRDFSFTNSSLFMAIGVALVGLLLLWGTSKKANVPGRLQSLAEMLYEFIADTVRTSAGNEGMKFFPLVFSLFMFILIMNLIGMVPYTFTVTSHIIVTFALAAIVILTVIIYGVAHHGVGFLKLFVPSGVPAWLLPLMIMIEVISFISRPISLSVRLFANMLAGHIALKIFAGFVATLLAAKGWAILAPLPLLLTVALTSLEMLVAVLQAYVFATLTCIYLSDALHPGH